MLFAAGCVAQLANAMQKDMAQPTMDEANMEQPPTAEKESMVEEPTPTHKVMMEWICPLSGSMTSAVIFFGILPLCILVTGWPSVLTSYEFQLHLIHSH